MQEGAAGRAAGLAAPGEVHAADHGRPRPRRDRHPDRRSARSCRRARAAPASAYRRRRFITARPVGTLPISAIIATSGWRGERARPPRVPPGTTLNTPGGNTPSISSARRSEDSGACSGGLTTMVLPAASGAADLPAQNMNGMVERDDAADHAERLAHREVDHVRSHRDRRALHLGDEAGEELDLRRGDRRVADHLRDRVAAVGGIDHRELVGVAAQDRAIRRRICARSQRRHVAPFREGRLRPLRPRHRCRRRRIGDLAERCPGAGIDGVGDSGRDFGACQAPP